MSEYRGPALDDINFGVKSASDGHRILGEINDVLKSRGLALNLGKTEIFTSKEVVTHFLVRENGRVNKLTKQAERLKSDSARARLAVKVHGELVKHLDDRDARNRDKLTKRYLTVLSKLASPDAIQIALELFLKGPGLREPAIRYISGLPFSRQTASAFRKLIEQVPRYDDMAKLLVVRGIVEHRVPKDARGRRFVSAISNSLGDAKTPFDWYAKFLLLSKYGEQHEVLTAFEKSRGVLRRDSFLARQAMAVLPRAAGVNFDKVYRSWQQEVSRGVADSASVAVNLMTFADAGFPSKGNRAYPYLFPKDARGAYPIPKFLLLCVIAASEHKAGKKVARPEVEKFVVDPWMQSAIRAINPLWFATKGKK